MRKKILSILALLCLTANSAWAQDPAWVRAGDTWNSTTKTLTVNTNPGNLVYATETAKANIEHVIITNGVTTIGDGTFQSCSKLTTVDIPATVKSIGQLAFNSTGLTTVAIPASVTEIGDFAFAHCYGLTTVYIGNGVITIERDAFNDCTAVEDVYCYAAPTALTSWDSDGDDFKGSKATTCHVFDKSLWSTSNVNVKFENLIDNEKAVSGVTANQDPENTSDYWCTYYNPLANVKINTANVEIYKATLSFDAKSVTLTQVTESNNVIGVGQAVMLKATSNTALSMELTSVASDGIYTGNDLEGGTTVEPGYDAYTLSTGTAGNKLGFYKFNGNLDGSKAHLEITSGSPARGFIGFDDEGTTAIRPTLNPSLNGGEWYDLSGRRLSGQPTKKGVYVRNGQKFIVK
jgi:hypothetical protein